ncbi:hypothetical protein PN498_08585 [Oscillatoria sp. CS-180]|uniref:hypothetical protein n=1 Tax=Oscillatoria sp. CS-180 TaxID=3021720 RepID=UPI00232E85E6|nr:hypothetical protein [Oscillatoria sp. CS-180]MDB9526040.1 hypothetical protein [Oscillatoria sp. CS-180]
MKQAAFVSSHCVYQRIVRCQRQTVHEPFLAESFGMSDISELLIALKEWRKSVRQLKKKGKTPQERSRQLERARRKVLAHLSKESVIEEIDDLIQSATSLDTFSAEDVRETLTEDAESLVTVELRTVHPLAVKRKALEKLTTHFMNTPDKDEPIANSDELKTIFLRLSLIIPHEYWESIPLSRKQKKRRRRDLAMGTLQTTLGIGLLAGNTQLESIVANSSYILGGNALMAAMQNLIGHLHDIDNF